MNLKSIFKKKGSEWISRGVDWIFPPLCEECRTFCRTRWLCPACWAHLALIDPEERCSTCFSPLDQECKGCEEKWFTQRGALWEDDRVVTRFIERRGETQTLAYLLCLQWNVLRWDVPDVLVPMVKEMERMVPWIQQFFSLFDLPPALARRGRFSSWGSSQFAEGQNYLLLGWQQEDQEAFLWGEALASFRPKKVYWLNMIEPKEALRDFLEKPFPQKKF